MPVLGSNGQTGQDKSLELPERNFVGVRVGCSQSAMSVLTQNVFGPIQAITEKVGHSSASRPNSRGQRNPQPVEWPYVVYRPVPRRLGDASPEGPQLRDANFGGVACDNRGVDETPMEMPASQSGGYSD